MIDKTREEGRVNFNSCKVTMLTVLFTLTVACAHVSPNYSASAVNVEEMKALSGGMPNKISIGPFTSDPSINPSITCRGEGPVSPPNNKRFELYIQEALVEELRISNLYDAASSRRLTAQLDSIDFSSAMTGGHWDIKSTFKADSVDPFTVSISYPFESSFIAPTACQQVAQAFPLATQKLIHELIKHPSFRKLMSDRK